MSNRLNWSRLINWQASRHLEISLSAKLLTFGSGFFDKGNFTFLCWLLRNDIDEIWNVYGISNFGCLIFVVFPFILLFISMGCVGGAVLAFCWLYRVDYIQSLFTNDCGQLLLLVVWGGWWWGGGGGKFNNDLKLYNTRNQPELNGWMSNKSVELLSMICFTVNARTAQRLRDHMTSK